MASAPTLRLLNPTQLDTALAAVDLATFHYGDWLLEQGYDFKSGRESTPLFGGLLRVPVPLDQDLLRRARRLRPRVRALARTRDHRLRQLLQPRADVPRPRRQRRPRITEMRNTTYQQPEWYRYVAAFAGDKDASSWRTPYGGVVPELIGLLGEGKGRDLFPALALRGGRAGRRHVGALRIVDGQRHRGFVYAPHGMATEIQDFLADHEHLMARRTANEVAVVLQRGEHPRADRPGRRERQHDQRPRRVRRGAYRAAATHAGGLGDAVATWSSGSTA